MRCLLLIGRRSVFAGEEANHRTRRSAHRSEERFVRQWARRGTRPIQPADQSYERLPFADTNAMQRHFGQIAIHVARGSRRPHRAAARPRRMAHHRQSRLAEEHHADPAAFALPGTQVGRASLVISARQLSLKSHLREPRWHHRRRLRRMAKAPRSAMRDHLNRNA